MINQSQIDKLKKIIHEQNEIILHAQDNIIDPANGTIDTCRSTLLEICLIDLKCKNPVEFADLQLDALESVNESFAWECKDSPLGYCIYDAFEDPCYDNCLYCNDPHERK